MPDPAVPVLRALAAGDRERALALARDAAPAAGVLGPALARHLAAGPTDAVYDEASAFESFIGYGTNPELYRRTIAALARLHADERPRTVVDIGCGDGRVTAGVLGPATEVVDLVEPSADLLRRAQAALAGSPATVRAHGRGIADQLIVDGDARWDVAQATFALHTLPRADRAGVLARLAGRVGVLALAEFDVPDIEGDEEARLRYLAARYELGVREYAGHPEVIAGFLMPVLVGQVEPGRVRHTFEGPATGWVAGLHAAGFRDVAVAPLHDYWWAPAVLVTARP